MKDTLTKVLRNQAFITSAIFGILLATPQSLPSPAIAIITNAIIIILESLIAWTINISLLHYFGEQTSKVSGHKKRIIVSCILNTLLAIILYPCIMYIMQYFPENYQAPLAFTSKKMMPLFIFKHLTLNTLILFAIEIVLLRNTKMVIELENARLKIKTTEARYEQLKQQIRPHMFFNSLNTIKSLYNNNSEDAEEYLALLSNFLRVSISNYNTKTIPLKEELSLCEDYLSMQKIRFGDALIWTFSVRDSGSSNAFVPSFSIQPLIENAIKHNEITEKHPLEININQAGNRIIVSNEVRLKESSEASSGFGLTNLAERYKLISHDEIEIKDDGHIFSVSIKILDNEDSNYRG